MRSDGESGGGEGGFAGGIDVCRAQDGFTVTEEDRTGGGGAASSWGDCGSERNAGALGDGGGRGGECGRGIGLRDDGGCGGVGVEEDGAAGEDVGFAVLVEVGGYGRASD